MDTKRVVPVNVILILFYVQSSLCVNEVNRNDFYRYLSRNIIPNADFVAKLPPPKYNSFEDSESLGKRIEMGIAEANRPMDIEALESMMAQVKAGHKRLAHYLQNNRKRETGDVYKNMFLGVRG